MKNSFKKRIRLIGISFSTSTILAVLLLTVSSCTDDYCKVTITNNTSIPIFVDCTEEGSNYNEELKIMPGESYTYTMTPGLLTVWAASRYAKRQNQWNYDRITVGKGENYIYNWYDNNSGVTQYNFSENGNGMNKRKGHDNIEINRYRYLYHFSGGGGGMW